MHDFLLAKKIIDETLTIIKDKNLRNIERVRVEIGNVSMAHDGFDEHPEEINLENLKFGLESIAKGTALGDADFSIKKVSGDSWKITDIEVK